MFQGNLPRKPRNPPSLHHRHFKPSVQTDNSNSRQCVGWLQCRLPPPPPPPPGPAKSTLTLTSHLREGEVVSYPETQLIQTLLSVPPAPLWIPCTKRATPQFNLQYILFSVTQALNWPKEFSNWPILSPKRRKASRQLRSKQHHSPQLQKS